MTRIVEIEIEGVAPYSQSGKVEEEKTRKESWKDFEQRVWRQKCYTDEAGNLKVPEMAFKQALDTAAKRLSEKIPGKGASTYTKHFVSGTLCGETRPFPVHRDDVQPQKVFANADGVRGSGTRVDRIFPQIPPGWKTVVTFYVWDDTITKSLFERYFVEAGNFVGVGRFRAEKGGMNGRWKCLKFTWSEE